MLRLRLDRATRGKPSNANNPLTRHPKIIEDEKAIEVVLRLEETPRPTAGANDHGRRFTITAVGSRLQGSDHRRISIAAGGIAAGNSIAIPPASQQRRDSSETISCEGGDLVVPARTVTVTTLQSMPQLEAIEEGRRG